MKLKKNSRYVFILQAFLKPAPAEASYLSMETIQKYLTKRVEDKKSYKLYNKNKIGYRIKDSKIYENRYLALLVSCADKDSSDPCFENFDNGTIEPIKKKENQGGYNAAHIVIDMQARINDKPIYNFALEKIPGLSPSRIQMFLRHEIKESIKGVFNYKDEKGTKKDYSTIIEIDGNASNTVREALQNGELKNVFLISHNEKQDGHDEENYIAEETQQIGMKMKSGIKSDKAVGFVEKQLNKWKNLDTSNYDTMIVRIATNQGVTKQASLDLDEENPLESSFYHQEIITDFKEPLTDFIEKLRDDVIMKMINLIKG